MAMHGTLQLTLPNEAAALPCALALVREAARQRGFVPEDIQRLELAAEEAVQNVLEHAYAQGEEATFTLSCKPDVLGLTVSVRDQGLPFDPSHQPPFLPQEDATDQPGLGTMLMQRLVDRLEFRNLGKEGKETRLVKLLPAEALAEDQLPPLQEEPEPTPTPGWNRELRFSRPEDALGICQCIYESYGYTYFREDFYYPERVAGLNVSGAIRSAVAVTPTGAVDGHAALVFFQDRPGIAELAAAAVRPRARGGKTMLGLTRFLVSEAQQLGLSHLFTECVTAHTQSQRLTHALGFLDCGFMLAWIPGSLVFRALAENRGERISLLINAYALLESPERELYPSLSLFPLLERIYTHLKRSPSLVPPQEGQTGRGTTALNLAVEPEQRRVHIQVELAGEDFPARLHQELYRLKRMRLDVCLLELPLADPTAAWACAVLEQFGFACAGILPGAAKGDSALFHYFNGIAIDYGAIQLDNAFAKGLLAEVRQRQLAAIR